MSFTGFSRAAMPAITESSGQSSPRESRYSRRVSWAAGLEKSRPLGMSNTAWGSYPRSMSRSTMGRDTPMWLGMRRKAQLLRVPKVRAARGRPM